MKMKAQRAILAVFLFIGISPITLMAQEVENDVEQVETQPSNADKMLSPQKERETTYRLETFGSLSTGDNIPYWMFHHTWGVVPLKSGNYYVRAGAAHQQQINRNISFDLGVDLVTSSKQDYLESFWLQQAYARVKWKSLQLSVGMKEDYQSIVDPYLSSGDMIHSNNARPNPEINISIPEFTVVPFTKKLLYVKGEFAVGKYLDGSYLKDATSAAKFANQNYVKDPLSHHKSLYFRIGNIERREKAYQFTFGFEHYVQWGGDLYLSKEDRFIKFPNGIGDLAKVIMAKEETKLVGNSPETYRVEAIGSHSATINAKFDYGREYGDEIFSIYYQHYINNVSGLKYENYPDMLLGVQYKTQYKQLISGIVLEYFYSRNQTNPEVPESPESPQPDNYYNSYTYPQGKSYFGMSTGTSLFRSPRYNVFGYGYPDGYIGFASNRVLALHVGIEGYFFNQFHYSLLGTFGETYGTYIAPLKNRQQGLASVANVTYSFEKISGLSITGSAAFNAGAFFGPNSYGGGITIKKTGKLF